MENIREIVLDMLLSVEREEIYSHVLVKNVLDKYDYWDNSHKAFLKRLFEGTVERRTELDYYLNSVSTVEVRKMKPLIRCLLRMSVYQLLYMDSVPDSAAINEAVKLAGKRKFVNLKGFVNGVLRKIASGKEQLSLPDREADFDLYLSVRYSMPQWICGMLRENYGDELTELILADFLNEKGITVRLAKQAGDTLTSVSERAEKTLQTLCESMKESGVQAMPHPWMPESVEVTHTDNPAWLPGFAEGEITIQDAASSFAVFLAGIRKGDTVLDICAAPGGKSMLAAELTGEDGLVIARDVSQARTLRMEENFERAGKMCLRAECFDGCVFDPSMEAKADVVLADVPCSGLGVMGHKRDIRYRQKQENLPQLYSLQKTIADNAVRYVKEEGIFVYSTCTLNPEENVRMREYLMKGHGLKPVDLSGCIPSALLTLEKAIAGTHTGVTSYMERYGIAETAKDGYLQLLPGVHDCDGFFVAVFRKEEKK